MNSLSPRERLIQRLLEVPVQQLPLLEQFLQSLEIKGAGPVTCASEHLQVNVEDAVPPASILDDSAGQMIAKDWPHAPLHRLSKHGTYIVTAGTLGKEHFFRGAHRLDYLESRLLTLTRQFGWQVEAWAVFSNHYHFIAHALPGCMELQSVLKQLHGETAFEVNRLDGQRGRQVWFNFWDTKLTYEKSYLARLNYVHQNAVKHGLVRVAREYAWCSAAWFERTASPAQVRTIYSFKTGRVKVVDDFDPV